MKQLRYSPFSIRRDLLLCSLLSAQQAAVSTSAAAIVPRLVNFSAKAIDQGKVLTGVTGIIFAIYSEETGGSPLWLETRNVQADSKGNYTAQLGVTKSEGLVEHSVMRARLPQAMKEMKSARAARLAPVDHNLLETASAPDKPSKIARSTRPSHSRAGAVRPRRIEADHGLKQINKRRQRRPPPKCKPSHHSDVFSCPGGQGNTSLFRNDGIHAAVENVSRAFRRGYPIHRTE